MIYGSYSTDAFSPEDRKPDFVEVDECEAGSDLEEFQFSASAQI